MSKIAEYATSGKNVSKKKIIVTKSERRENTWVLWLLQAWGVLEL